MLHLFHALFLHKQRCGFRIDRKNPRILQRKGFRKHSGCGGAGIVRQPLSLFFLPLKMGGFSRALTTLLSIETVRKPAAPNSVILLSTSSCFPPDKTHGNGDGSPEFAFAFDFSRMFKSVSSVLISAISARNAFPSSSQSETLSPERIRITFLM